MQYNNNILQSMLKHVIKMLIIYNTVDCFVSKNKHIILNFEMRIISNLIINWRKMKTWNIVGILI